MENEKPEVNERGNTITRSFFPEADRYKFDDEFKSYDGWKQYDTDQDERYFGCWINKDKKQVATYAKGDLTLCECKTIESFNAEIEFMNHFYGEGFEYKAINDNGNMTIYRQDRKDFFI